MQSANISHTFDFALASVLEARYARYTDKDYWPEISGSDVQKEEKDGNIVSQRRLTKIEIPMNPVLGKVFTNNMIEIIEETYYDPDKGIFNTEATVEQFKILEIIEISKYKEFEESETLKTKRDIEIRCRVNIPMMGKQFSKLVLKEFCKRSDEDYERLVLYYNEVLASKAS